MNDVTIALPKHTVRDAKTLAFLDGMPLGSFLTVLLSERIAALKATGELTQPEAPRS